ncbi:MAG: Gfo/Idh/MocA family oxidoreductase [Spirochaetaceae bacterium]|jgi:predicted dehydrogenase|nr:Gfo/Idh/MocA family oxidoreductase [Spirochaetaceae bacterium]
MKKLSWGVIGAGGIADRRTLPGMMLAKNASLAAVMEIEAGPAETLRKKYNAAKAYTSVEELLADPVVEAVYIASPVSAHYKQALAAAEAGKHILIEKPVALSLDEGKELVKICAEKKLQFSAGFMMRFHPCHRELREIISGGGLGKIVSLRAQLTCWYPEIPGAWRQDPALSGGGALMDMGIHCIDLLQYLTGSRAVRVSALIGTRIFSYAVDDSASLIMEFENGAHAFVDAFFNIPDDASENRLEIYGTGGCALAAGTIGQTGGGSCSLVYSNPGGYNKNQNREESRGRQNLSWTEVNPYTLEIESFGDSLLNGNKPEVPAKEALQVQRVIACAYKAARENRTVEIPSG